MNEVIERINSLNPYEAQGYNCHRLRQLQDLMLEFPDRAKIAFEIFDFATNLWGGDLAQSMKKHPLTHIGSFFYDTVASVNEWVELQIIGMKQQVTSNNKYITTLKRQKEKDFWQDSNTRLEKEIVKYNNALIDYMIFN